MHVCRRAEPRAQNAAKRWQQDSCWKYSTRLSASAGDCVGDRLDTVNRLDNRSTRSPLSLGLVPGGIRVIGSHRLCKFCGVWTEVLFINGPGLVDNKSHHTRGAVLDGIGDEGEACAHLPIDDIFPGSARCMSSLASEDAEHISVERNMLANLICWEILPRVSDERVDRAVKLVVGPLPVQTVVPAFVADQLLRILFRDASWRTGEVLLLRFDQSVQRICGRDLVFAYAAEENLVFPIKRGEIPGTVIVRQGNWKRPILSAYNQRHLSVRLSHESMHLLIFGDESYASIRILYCIAGREHILCGRAKDAQWGLFVL